MFHHLRIIGAIVLMTGVLLVPPAIAEDTPTVEIFPNQQPILLGLNQQKIVTLFGAVYDEALVDGVVDIAPNGPTETACPIFLSGLNTQVTVPDNTTNVPFSLTVRGPSNPQQAGQTFGCALRYRAFRVIRNTFGQGFLVPVNTLGNEVRFQYTVKKSPQ